MSAPGRGRVNGEVRLSVLVPARNAARELAECLAALGASTASGMEILVVDDASTDDTAAVAAAAGARVLRLPRRAGPAAARNHGARAARGEILLFVDADVVLRPGVPERVLAIFATHPEVAAVFGSYDAEPRAPGLVSQYRNLLHCYVHQRGHAEASTFWAGCGAVRRAVFEAVGGFDAARYPAASIEDIELGYRLRRAGYVVRLEKSLLGTHLKRWTLCSVVRTDVRARALPWSRLLLETGWVPDDLNVSRRQRASVALVGAGMLGLATAPFRPEALAVGALLLGLAVALNRDLFAFLRRQRGLRFALGCVPLHLLYFVSSGASYVYAWIAWHLTPAGPVAARRRGR